MATVTKKPVAFTIEAPKQNPGGGEDVDSVRAAALTMRAKLMKFPEATLVENQKIDGETSIVISVKPNAQIEMPKSLDFMDFVKGKDGDKLAEYKLKSGGFRVFVKYLEAKVAALSENTNVIRPKSPIKWTQKRKRATEPAPGSPSKWPVGGFKLPRSRLQQVKKPETFFISLDAPEKAAPKSKVKSVAIKARPLLMSFPGARRVRYKKGGSIVLYVKSVPTELPEVDYMKKDGNGYVLEGFKVELKAQSKLVKSIKTKSKYKGVTGIKWTKKSKPSVAPAPAPDSPTEITGGPKLTADKAVKFNPAFFVHVPIDQGADKGIWLAKPEKKSVKAGHSEGAPCKCCDSHRTTSFKHRRDIMESIKGARRLTRFKEGQEYGYKLYIKSEVNQQFPDETKIMTKVKSKSDKELAKYLLRAYDYTVVVLEDKHSVKSLKVSKRKPGQVTRLKAKMKVKPAIAPKAAEGTQDLVWPGEECKKTKRE